MHYTANGIARVAHEAQRVLQVVVNEPVPAPEWNHAPAYMKEALIKSVWAVLEGSTAEETHELWLRDKIRDGWTYAPIKDAYAKTHPCLMDYDKLPQYQRDKNALLVAIVNALANSLIAQEFDDKL